MLLIDNKAIFVHIPRTGGMFTRQVINKSNLDHKQINVTHGSLLKIDTEGLYSFGYVRNPWAWQVSIFLQFTGMNNKHAFAQYTKQNIEMVYSMQRRYYEQFYANGEPVISEIFKTEELEYALNTVYDKFNWEKPDDLLNMTSVNTKLHGYKKTYHEYYDDKMKELVYRHNADIIEKYNYSFE